MNRLWISKSMALVIPMVGFSFRERRLLQPNDLIRVVFRTTQNHICKDVLRIDSGMIITSLFWSEDRHVATLLK